MAFEIDSNGRESCNEQKPDEVSMGDNFGINACQMTEDYNQMMAYISIADKPAAPLIIPK